MRLEDEFLRRAGHAPDGVWSSPGRVNLIGEHTDHQEGFVLPIAIDLAARVAARRRDDDVVRCWSLQQPGLVEASVSALAPGVASDWGTYVFGAVWALRELGVPVPGVDVVVDSTVPLGAGLSSSAALMCAVALAVRDLAGVTVDAPTLAAACRRGEQELVGAPVGPMDQLASLCATPDHALLIDCRTLTLEQVPFDLAAAGLALLVIVTGTRHDNAGAGYSSILDCCRAAARAWGVGVLRDAPDPLPADAPGCARHVVSENQRVLEVVRLLRDNGPPAVGALLTASHASMRDDLGNSTPVIDAAVEAAVDAGALGARMTGGGFGGSAIALVQLDRVQHVIERTTRALRAVSAPEPTFSTVTAAAAGGAT